MYLRLHKPVPLLIDVDPSAIKQARSALTVQLHAIIPASRSIHPNSMHHRIKLSVCTRLCSTTCCKLSLF